MAQRLNTFFQSTILVIIALLLIHFGSNIVMPLFFSILASIALTPLARKLESFGLGRTTAAVLIMVTGTAMFAGIIFILFHQAQSLLDSLPELSAKYDHWIKAITRQIEQETDISTLQQKELFESNSEQFLATNLDFIKSSFSAVVDFMSFMAVTPFYMVFLLIYRGNLKTAIHRISKSSSTEKLSLSIVRSVEDGLQSYLKGLLVVTTLIAIMNAIGFLIIGLDYAILLAVLGALLTMIPYVGVFIGALIPMLVALLTKDQIIYPVLVLGIAGFVQFLEGSFITPRIIGSRVGVNPAFIIFSVIAMGALSGVIGMILAGPMLAVVKIIFESIDALKPLSALMSGTLEEDAEDE